MKRAAAVLLTLVTLLAVLAPGAWAAESSVPEHKVIRVGFPQQDGISEVDSAGNYSGYTYEYLEALAQFTGWSYEFVTPEGSVDEQLTTLMDMLSKGEIDLMGCMNRSDALETMFEYPSLSYGTGYTNLAAPIENTALNEVSFPSYAKQGIRVGAFATSATRQSQLAAYCEMNGYSYELVTYETLTEMQQLMDDGLIDVNLGSDLSCGEGLKTVAYFSGSPFYFVSYPGNTQLMDELDQGMAQLEQSSPSIQKNLHDKYFRSEDYGFFTTAEEDAYLESAPVIRVLSAWENAPYQHKGDSGEYEGICIEILKKLTAQTGLQFEFVDYDPTKSIPQQVAEQDVQMVMGTPYDYDYAQANDLIAGSAIVDTELTVFSKGSIDLENVSDLTMAALPSTAVYEPFSDADMVYCDSLEACMDLVSAGGADFGYGNAYSVSYYLEQNPASHLNAIQVPGQSMSLCFSFVSPDNTALITLVNRMVDATSSSEIYTWVMDELANHKSTTTLRDFVALHPTQTVLIATGVLLVFCAVAIIVVHSRAKQRIYASKLQAESTFLSRMSHEIRTPLNAVIGYLTIAQMEDSQPEKIHHCVENGQLAAKHLLSIINDVLDMSAIESGRIKIAREDYNLKQQITSISSIFYTQAKSKGVTFEVRLNHLTEEWIVGDSLRVNQVLMNLLSNAVKFTPAGGSVELVVDQLDCRTDAVDFRFTVRDTGIGISEAYQKQIFTPFEQESAHTAQSFGGTGLGLSISKNLTALMGGELTVESKQGVGSAFTVNLTFGRCRESPRGRAVSTDYTKIHALIVDDEQSEREYIKQLLDRFGVKSTQVSGGAEAVRKIRSRMNTEFAFDLCIMDWKMPECDGISCAKMIREVCASDLPIIIVTAYDISEIQQPARDAGVSKVVSKPLFPSTLSDLLVTTFGKYEPEILSGTAGIDLHGKRVLLAEDNTMNLEIAVDILKKFGLEVDTAEDGRQAVDRFLASPAGHYSGILMDIQMPVMDGYEATRTIRASHHPEAATIPIIAMTANAFNEDVAAALACGMNGHIAKPIEYNKLMHILSKYLESDSPDA